MNGKKPAIFSLNQVSEAEIDRILYTAYGSKLEKTHNLFSSKIILHVNFINSFDDIKGCPGVPR